MTDAIAPTTTSNGRAIYGESATIDLAAADNVGGTGVVQTYYVLDGGTETTGTSLTVTEPGTHQLQFWSVDAAGNAEDPRNTLDFVVDPVAPTTTSDAQATYAMSAVISLEATDTGGAGVASTHYSLDGAADETGTAVSVSESGTHVLEFWSVDAAGNVETPHKTVTFVVDAVAPTTTSDAAASYDNTATITLSATDNSGGTGVATTFYSLDSAPVTSGTEVTATTAGVHTLEFWSVDEVGNIETPHKAVTFTVNDTIAPSTVSDAVESYADSATVSFTATDNAGGSGVAETRYILDTAAEATGTVVNVAIAGTHTVEFWSVDAAGNSESQHTTITFTIADTIAPTTSSDVVDVYTGSAAITLAAEDNPGGLGVAETWYVLDGLPAASGTSVNVTDAGTHTLEFWSLDAAGNVEQPHHLAQFTVQ